MIETRPMTPDDVDGAEELWARADGGLANRTPSSAARQRRQIAHKLATDPGGSWVATSSASSSSSDSSASSAGLVGIAQALMRDGVWVLSLLGVDPTHQDRGVGRLLLERALAYGDPDSPGVILSSSDARALRRYALAGFALHPAVAARGTPRPLSSADTVVEAGPEWRDLIDASRVEDVAVMLEQDARLLVDGAGGFAVVEAAARIRALTAPDSAAAGRLLTAALARADGGEAEVRWMTSGQQWAIAAVVAAGLGLRPQNAVMIRGWAGPPANCLPSGAFGMLLSRTS